MKATKQRGNRQKGVTLKDLTSVEWYVQQLSGDVCWERLAQVQKLDELWKIARPRSDEEKQWRKLWQYALPRMDVNQPILALLQSALEMRGVPAVRAAVSEYLKWIDMPLTGSTLLVAQGLGNDAVKPRKLGKVLRMCVHRDGMCVAVHNNDVVSVWRPDGTLAGTHEIKDTGAGARAYARLVGDALLVVKTSVSSVSVVPFAVRCDGVKSEGNHAKENNPVVAYWDCEEYGIYREDSDTEYDGLPILELPGNRCFAWNAGNLDRALMMLSKEELTSIQVLEERHPLRGTCAHVLYDATREDRQRVALKRLQDWRWHMHMRRLDMVWRSTENGVAVYGEDGTLLCVVPSERQLVAFIDEDVVATWFSHEIVYVWRIADAEGSGRVIRKPQIIWKHGAQRILRLRDGGFAVVEAFPRCEKAYCYAANGRLEHVLKCPQKSGPISSLMELPDGRILAYPISEDWFENPPVVWNRAGKREDVVTHPHVESTLPMVSGEVWGLSSCSAPLFGTRTFLSDLRAIGVAGDDEIPFLYSWSPLRRVQIFLPEDSYAQMIKAFVASVRLNQGKCCLAKTTSVFHPDDTAVSAVTDGTKLMLWQVPDCYDGRPPDEKFISWLEKACRSTQLSKESLTLQCSEYECNAEWKGCEPVTACVLYDERVYGLYGDRVVVWSIREL